MTNQSVDLAVHSLDSFVASGHAGADVYFTAGYGRAEVAHGAGEWLSVTALGGLWQLPIHLRSSSLGVDAVSPYGYAGVYADATLSARDLRRAWQQAKAELSNRGVLSLFLRQTPLFDSPFDAPPGEEIVSGHQTVEVDTRCKEAAWQRMEGRSRTSIRKAERDGFSSSLRAVRSADLVQGSAFRDLYEGAMQRREAADRYFFGNAYYETLLASLGADLLIAETVAPDGAPVAAALFMRHGRRLHYHLSGSVPQAGRAGATNQLVWRAMEWASENAVESLHLGGGVSPQDSLFKFKRSFGGRLLTFDAFGIVLNENGYRTAVQSRADELGKSAADVACSGFFPRFRAPA